MVVARELVPGQHVVVEEPAVVDDAGDQLHAVALGRRQHQLAGPRLERVEDHHRPVDAVAEALQAVDHVEREAVRRAGRDAEHPRQAGRLDRLQRVPDRFARIARAIGVVQQQQVEGIDAAALQAALRGHPHVVRVALRSAQARIGETGETLGTFSFARVEIVSDGAHDGEIRAGDPGERATKQSVGRAGAIGVRRDDRRDTLIWAQQGSEPVFVDRLPEVHEATAAPCPDRGTCQLRPTFFPKVFTQGPHAMADDTRVTHSRVGLACAVALLCVIGCSLPAAASAAEIIVRRDAGLSAARARRRARRRRGRAGPHAGLPGHRGRPVPAGAEARRWRGSNADPDVRYAVPNVTLQRRRRRGDAVRPVGARDADVFARSAPTPTSTRPRRGTRWRAGRDRRRGRPARRREPPGPGRQRRARHARTSLHRRLPAGDPTGADHGTHIAGMIAALRDNGRHRRRRAAGASAAAAGRRQLRRRRRSLASSRRFTYAGRSAIPIVSASFGTEPCHGRPAAPDQPDVRATSSTPTPTRCSSSPPATRAPTSTTTAGLPLLARCDRRHEPDIRT